MIESVEVEARYDPDGRPTPLALVLKSRRHPIVDHGRQWTDSDGRHFLVTVAGGQIFQLNHNPSTGTWTAERVAGGPAIA